MHHGVTALADALDMETTNPTHFLNSLNRSEIPSFSISNVEDIIMVPLQMIVRFTCGEEAMLVNLDLKTAGLYKRMKWDMF